MSSQCGPKSTNCNCEEDALASFQPAAASREWSKCWTRCQRCESDKPGPASMQENEETLRGTRVQVVVRVRPVLPSEIQQEAAVTCSPDGSRVQVVLPQRGGEKEQLPGAPRAGARSFKFDACLPGSTTQEDLFETCGMAELVDAALDGYSVTVFAFGQTGSGKTHTMIGPRLSRAAAAVAGGAAAAAEGGKLGSGSETVGAAAAGGAVQAGPLTEDGVLPRCVQYAYDSIASRQSEAQYTVCASVLELYNESVTDLLGPDKGKQLQVRKDERNGFQVPGLTQVQCSTSTSALNHMKRALAVRQTRAHRLNDYSSRSHCIVTFVFASKERVDGGGGASDGAERQQGAKGGIRRYGKLVLVDLAGSERLKETGNTDKDAIRETGFINKSLFTLGQVLAALSTRSTSAGIPAHVPYRDSKLTQLLWDGLRGTGRALMLACLGPTMTYAEESVNTLHFAGMAQRIKASPVVLLDPADQLVLDLRNTIRALQEENRQLATSLQQLSSGADIQDVIDMLPEKLRAAAGAPGPPPDSAPAAYGGLAGAVGGQPGRRPAPATAWGATAMSRDTVSSAGLGDVATTRGVGQSVPWRAADDTQLPATPSNANVLRLQPLTSSRLSPATHGRGGGKAAVGASRLSHTPATAAAAASAAAYAAAAPRNKANSAPPHTSACFSPPLGSRDPLAFQDQEGRVPGARASPSSTQKFLSAHRGDLGQAQSHAGGKSVNLQRRSLSSSIADGYEIAGAGGDNRGDGARGKLSLFQDLDKTSSSASAASKRGSGRREGGSGGLNDSGGSNRRASHSQVASPSQHLRSYANLKFAKQAGVGAGAGSGMGVPPRPAASGTSGATTAAGAIDPATLLCSPARLMDPDAFPELAALEAEFQKCLASGPPLQQDATCTVAGEGAGAGTSGSGLKSDAAAAATVRASVKALAGGSGGHQARNSGLIASATSESAAVGPSGDGMADGSGVEEGPDIRALKWAVKNTWFGSDAEMTAFAYRVHDQLVDVEHIDPSSETYYLQLELHVSGKFLDRWAAWHQRRQREQEQLAAERARDKAPPPAEHSAAQAFGRALRVAVKDALSTASGTALSGTSSIAHASSTVGAGGMFGGMSGRVHGFRNMNAVAGSMTRGGEAGAGSGEGTLSVDVSVPHDGGKPQTERNGQAWALLPAVAAGKSIDLPHTSLPRRPQQQQQLQQQQQQQQRHQQQQSPSNSNTATGTKHRQSHLMAVRQSEPSASAVAAASRASTSVTTASSSTRAAGATASAGVASSSGLNPFNLHALNPPSPVRQQQHRRKTRAAAPPQGSGAAAAAAAQPRAKPSELPSPLDFGSYEDMQAEYLRQRALVVNELRLAKEQAEVERARIMGTINKMLGASRWRK